MDTALPEINLKKYDKLVLTAISGGLLLLFAVALYALYVFMPMLVELAKDTVYFLAMSFIAVLLLITAGELWMSRDAIYYKMKVFARNIRKAVVREDPIGVLDVAIHRFESKLEDIDKSLSDAAAAKKRLQHKIRNSERTGALDMAESEESLAMQAKKRGQSESAVAQHAVAADRWRNAATSLQPTCDNLDRMGDALSRARDLCASTLEDRKNQKQVMSVQLEAIQESQQSVRSFKRFMTHSTDLDMMELSIDEIERQSTEAEAEIDQFLKVITPQLESADLKKSAESERAVSKMNAYIDQKALPEAVPDATILTHHTQERVKS